MSGINIENITSKTLLGATFAQATYPNKGGSPFTPPVDFVAVKNVNFTPSASSSLTGFAAQAYVNVKTGELVIAYRGSDNPLEAANAALWASTGTWHPQFTDATNYAAAARTAALAKVNEYRESNKQSPLTQLDDDKILVTGHSLGGLLSQVVSKMFGWSAQVYDSLGGGKLVYSTDPVTGKQGFSAEFTAQANKLGLTVNGQVVDHDVSGKIQNWGTSHASDVGTQLGTNIDIPALGQVGGGVTLGVLTMFFVNPVAGMAGAFASDQFIGKHDKFSIEAAVYSLGVLKDVASGAGDLHVRMMSLSQAKGEGDALLAAQGAQVPALVDADGRVWAYYERTDKAFKITVTQGENTGVTLLIARAGEASNSDIQITRIGHDHSEHIYTRDELIEKLKVPGKDYLSQTTYERADGMVQETTLADGIPQYQLLNEDGSRSALASNEYMGRTADGALAKFQISDDGNTEGSIILSGERSGETFTRTWHNGNPALQMGVADDGSGRHLDYTLTYTDKTGRTVSVESKPVFEGQGDGRSLVGAQMTQTVMINGVKVEERIGTQTFDVQTQQQTQSLDVTTYNAQGQFVGRNFESTIQTTSGIYMGGLITSYDKQGNLTGTALTQRQNNNVLRTTMRDAQGATVQTVDKQTFDDGSSRSETHNAQGQLMSSSTTHFQELAGGQSVQVTETVNHLAQGHEVASSKELVTSGGARIVNSTRADGHISEETWATVDGKAVLQSSKVLSYSQAERDVAALDVSLAGLEFLQALRSGNKVQAAGSLIRLVNNAEIASNKMPTLGVIGTGFSGAVSIVSALDSWGDASDGERIALTARAVLGANEVAKAFSANGQTGFLESSAALGALQGVVALASLDATINSGNPFAIASTVMTLGNSAAAVGLIEGAAPFGPQAMIAVAIASIVFGSFFGDDIEYPAPPPAGTLEVGHLADGSLGLLIKDADGHTYQTRSLAGQVLSDEGKATDNQDWVLGAQVLSERITGLIGELQAQAAQDGTHLVLDRLPTLSVHGYPSFDGNGVDNFFFALRFNDPGTGAQQLMAAANQDMAQQFKEVASHAGALVDATEWAQIQAKQAAGDVYATETEGQYVDRQSGANDTQWLCAA